MYFWSVSLVNQLSGQFLIFLVDQFFLVDQKPISHFFCRPIFFLVNQKPFSHVFGRPIFFLVDQKKKEKLSGQLVDQREWPKDMDAAKVQKFPWSSFTCLTKSRWFCTPHLNFYNQYNNPIEFRTYQKKKKIIWAWFWSLL